MGMIRRKNQMYEKLADEIIGGRRLTREDDVTFLKEGNLEDLKKAANRIREALCGNSSGFDIAP